ncbi:hypothetical protein B4U79_17920 [Dinothrombium tinctorium]|uniref:G-protein coupled receptors family 2 profile 1 domain-containing protein n=1 Tax=Dinothrombium tinctorium TaxID=1965070 RepID=A0A3S3QWH5_9ACAR|nr:hypothetical protein B4U79_18111 [Dinothrombium tinctorium]RWS15110.1 hypothetical protein B4U79_17920 [Dinothrombium tinctorium]
MLRRTSSASEETRNLKKKLFNSKIIIIIMGRTSSTNATLISIIYFKSKRIFDHFFSKTTGDQLYCPAKWDGWSCWGYTPAGTTAYQTCPDFAYQNHRKYQNQLPESCLRDSAEKYCTPNGTWYKYKGYERTNYLNCAYIGRRERRIATFMKVTLQSISLVFSLASIAIFIYYKQYRIVRIQVHLNFFASFVLTAIATIAFNIYIYGDHLEDDGVVISSNADKQLNQYRSKCKAEGLKEEDLRR